MPDEPENTSISAPIGIAEKKQKSKKTTVKKPRVQRVGHCNTCKHEWVSRTGADDRPAKCPNCGSYDCTWRDQMPTAAPKKEPMIMQPEQTMALTPPAQEEEKPPKEPEPPKEEKEVEVKPITMKEAETKLNKEYETIRQDLSPGISSGGLVIAVGVLALVGAGYFLIKSGKISLPQIKRETPKKEEPQPIQETRQEAPRRPTPAPAPMTIQRMMMNRNLMGGRII